MLVSVTGNGSVFQPFRPKKKVEIQKFSLGKERKRSAAHSLVSVSVRKQGNKQYTEYPASLVMAVPLSNEDIMVC